MSSHFCKSCGAEIAEGTLGNCPICGATPATSPDRKNPVLAAVQSLFIPGLGQSYNGNALNGLGVFLCVSIWSEGLIGQVREL